MFYGTRFFIFSGDNGNDVHVGSAGTDVAKGIRTDQALEIKHAN